MFKFLKSLFGFSKLVSIWLLILLLAAVCTNAIVLEQRYMGKYERLFSAMQNEFEFRMMQLDYDHQRQLAVGNILRSQQKWEDTAAILSDSYEREKALRLEAENETEKLRYEMYAFLKVLERKYPGVTAEIEFTAGPFIRLVPETPDESRTPERPLVPFEDRGPSEGSSERTESEENLLQVP